MDVRANAPDREIQIENKDGLVIAVQADLRASRRSFLNGRIEVFKRSVATRRGTLLGVYASDSPASKSYRLAISCVRKHVFYLTAKNLARGAWCADCKDIEAQLEREAMLRRIHEFAAQKNGRCLSTIYIDARTPMSWVCAYGHEWPANWDNVANKQSWCPVCALRRTIATRKPRKKRLMPD